MAHNLNSNKGKISFFSVKEKAWHNLGTILENCPTAEEAIIHAGLNFTVDKTANFCKIGDNLIQTPGAFSTYRTDNNVILGDKLGNVYQVVQNRDAFKFFDAIVGESEAVYETAGCLGQGETIFISAKMPSYIRVGKDDVEKYLLLTMSHDGSGAITAMFSPVRTCCQNTLNAALNGKGHRITIRHTRNAERNLMEAHKLLGITNLLSLELEQIFTNMFKVKIDDKMLKSYIEQVFLPSDKLLEIRAGKLELTKNQSKIIESVTDYYFTGPGQDTEMTKGNMWGAYNAVTGYFSNVKEYKSEEKKMKNSILGHDYTIMQSAFDLAVKSI